MKPVFVIVDAQKDFATGALRNEEAIKALPVINQMITYAENNDLFVVYTMDTHDSDYLQTQEGKNLPVEHCIKGTPGWLLCSEVRPGAKARLIEKDTFGTFNIEYFVPKKVEEIVVCGFCTDICVSANFQILKAQFPETPIYVISDACAGVTPELHEAALKVISSCQGKIMTWEEYKEKKEYKGEA